MDPVQFHRRIAFVPFVKVTLTALKPRDFATNPQTLGEYLKKRRRELGLYQRDVALRLASAEEKVMTLIAKHEFTSW